MKALVGTFNQEEALSVIVELWEGSFPALAASPRYPGDDVRDFHHFPRGNVEMLKTFRSLIF